MKQFIGYMVVERGGLLPLNPIITADFAEDAHKILRKYVAQNQKKMPPVSNIFVRDTITLS